MRPLREQIYMMRGDRYNPPVAFQPVIKCYVDEEFSFDVHLAETKRDRKQRTPYTRAVVIVRHDTEPSDEDVAAQLKRFSEGLVDAVEAEVGTDGFLLYLTAPYSTVLHEPDEEKPWAVYSSTIMCAGRVSFEL